MKIYGLISIFVVTATASFAGNQTPAISGDYLEVRSCDVYTGPCFANAEMNLTGKEGMLLWSVREGRWKGTKVDGAYPVFTDVATFNGEGLDVTWQISGKRSAFLASFSM